MDRSSNELWWGLERREWRGLEFWGGGNLCCRCLGRRWIRRGVRVRGGEDSLFSASSGGGRGFWISLGWVGWTWRVNWGWLSWMSCCWWFAGVIVLVGWWMGLVAYFRATSINWYKYNPNSNLIANHTKIHSKSPAYHLSHSIFPPDSFRLFPYLSPAPLLFLSFSNHDRPYSSYLIFILYTKLKEKDENGTD